VSGPSALLFDVEGTITSLAFVKDELFPHARRALPQFLPANAARPAVSAIVYRLAQELKSSPADLDGISAALVRWIDEDRKHPELKELQGMIWEEGYEIGAFRGHLYPDVVPFWERTRAAGERIAIYSSGSEHAQRLLLQHPSRETSRAWSTATSTPGSVPRWRPNRIDAYRASSASHRVKSHSSPTRSASSTRRKGQG